MLDYLESGQFKGLWPSSDEKKVLENAIRKEGLVTKMLLSDEKYIDAIKIQIKIVSALKNRK